MTTTADKIQGLTDQITRLAVLAESGSPDLAKEVIDLADALAAAE